VLKPVVHNIQQLDERSDCEAKERLRELDNNVPSAAKKIINN
jgi:hypothetical protein